ncbi:MULTISPECIES: DUF3592 domain-containing protein [unclassified Streptomyces]|uniref:DUF3592 domain-containing protein n=1 Tax=unclassified Streptomyces TaxID=2593676 RepID=UPI0033A94F97
MNSYWLLTLIPFLAGLALTGQQAMKAITEHVLRRTARRLEGTVTGHVATREASYATLNAVVRWTGEDGTEHERAVPGMINARSLSEGSRVHVLSTPGSPESVVLDSPERYRAAIYGVWLGVLLWAGALTAVLIRIATLLPEHYYRY